MVCRNCMMLWFCCAIWLLNDIDRQKSPLQFVLKCKGLGKWWAQLGSNQRPDDYESSALTD